jgi:hypothetical protein
MLEYQTIFTITKISLSHHLSDGTILVVDGTILVVDGTM